MSVVPAAVDQIGRPRTFYPAPYNPYPPEYNPRIHGAFDPARYYGNKIKPSIWNVKLNDMFHFFTQRDYAPKNMLEHTRLWFTGKYAKHCRCSKTPAVVFFQSLYVVFIVRHFLGLGIIPGSVAGARAGATRKYHW